MGHGLTEQNTCRLIDNTYIYPDTPPLLDQKLLDKLPCTIAGRGGECEGKLFIIEQEPTDDCKHWHLKWHSTVVVFDGSNVVMLNRLGTF